MNYKNQLIQDYNNCIQNIKFWKRIIESKMYEDIFSLSELSDILNYYYDMKKFIEKELLKYEI